MCKQPLKVLRVVQLEGITSRWAAGLVPAVATVQGPEPWMGRHRMVAMSTGVTLARGYERVRAREERRELPPLFAPDTRRSV